MIASHHEWSDALHSVLDQCVEITVVGNDCRLKLPSPVGVLTQGNVKYLPLLSFILPLCPFSSLSQGTRCRAGSLFFSFFSFFTKLNALIKPFYHWGRDKWVMPSASLELSAFALCSIINWVSVTKLINARRAGTW